VIALLALGCGLWGPPDCTSDEVALAEAGGEALTCGEAAGVADYAELLSLRPLGSGDRNLLNAALASGWKADRAGTEAAIAEAAQVLAALKGSTGAEAAKLRSEEAWKLHQGEGTFAKLPDVRTVVDRSVSVWAQKDEERLVLTEMDIEGWIRYASLCRQAQGGDAMRVSIADRLEVYNVVRDRFTSGTPADREALLAIGAFWPSISEAWEGASYEEQQAWIGSAPLPPPMTATSLGYFEAIIEGDVAGHARAVHVTLGPLGLQVTE
jgi:hypothetical protein